MVVYHSSLSSFSAVFFDTKYTPISFVLKYSEFVNIMFPLLVVSLKEAGKLLHERLEIFEFPLIKTSCPLYQTWNNARHMQKWNELAV